MTHIAVDFAEDPAKAQERWTPDTVRAYLDEAVKATGLTRFGPEVVEENGPILMGFQMIAESHVSVHADRPAGRGWADVFSCKHVSAGQVAFAVDRTFGGWQVIRRIPRVELKEVDMRKWSSSPRGRLVLRFLRTMVAIGLGAALTWAANHGADLGLDAYWTAAFAGVVAAVGKMLRDANVLPSDWSPV